MANLLASWTAEQLVFGQRDHRSNHDNHSYVNCCASARFKSKEALTLMTLSVLAGERKVQARTPSIVTNRVVSRYSATAAEGLSLHHSENGSCLPPSCRALLNLPSRRELIGLVHLPDFPSGCRLRMKLPSLRREESNFSFARSNPGVVAFLAIGDGWVPFSSSSCLARSSTRRSPLRKASTTKCLSAVLKGQESWSIRSMRS